MSRQNSEVKDFWWWEIPELYFYGIVDRKVTPGGSLVIIDKRKYTLCYISLKGNVTENQTCVQT